MECLKLFIAESEIVQSCPTLCWTVAYQAPPSMGFSKQEYWSGLSFSSIGDLPNPGLEPGFPTLQADALPSEPPGKPSTISLSSKKVLHSNLLLPLPSSDSQPLEENPLLYPHYRMLQLHLTMLSSTEQFPLGLLRSMLTVLVLGLTKKFSLSL